MPHISNFRLAGVRIPSVNTVTDSLSKEGLYRNFFRRLGFAEADRVGGLARKKGISLALALENYRKLGKIPRKKFEKICLAQWVAWLSTCELVVNPEFVEPHLVNTVDGYHGSPDIVMCDMYGQGVLGDDKAKKRFSDYKVLMNEAAYAHCDSYEVNGEVKPVPWTVPITGVWIWTYNPDTGTIHPEYKVIEKQWYEDFLTCKKMYRVNRTAENYFLTVEKIPEDAA